MGLQYSPEDQQKIADAIAKEVGVIDTKNRRELLAAVHACVHDLGVFDDKRVAKTQARLATLLVRLSEEQEKVAARMEQQTDRLVKQTDRLVDFTKGLYWFTAALLVLGVIQLVVAFVCRP